MEHKPSRWHVIVPEHKCFEVLWNNPNSKKEEVSLRFVRQGLARTRFSLGWHVGESRVGKVMQSVWQQSCWWLQGRKVLKVGTTMAVTWLWCPSQSTPSTPLKHSERFVRLVAAASTGSWPWARYSHLIVTSVTGVTSVTSTRFAWCFCFSLFLCSV